jgi:flagella basal body P-ring formation protein FlgA
LRLANTLLAVVLMHLSAHLFAAVELDLKPESMVRGPRLLLGDVLAGQQGNTSEIDAIKSIDLGSAPIVGYSAYITRNEIERLIRSQGFHNTIVWQGAKTARIERLTRQYRSESIVEAAESYLYQIQTASTARLVLTQPTRVSDIQLPYGEVELKPRSKQIAQLMRQQTTVSIDVFVDGTFIRTVVVPFNVKAYRAVLTAKSDLMQGTIPQCDALELVEIDVALLNIGAQVFTNCSPIQGRLKRNLAQGTPLTSAYLEASHAVTQGDTVFLKIVDGAITLESRSIALSNGDIGQRINVKPSTANQAIRVEVMAPGVVKISEGN